MGLGDWIMATSQVRLLHEQFQRPVCVMDRYRRAKWSDVFQNNPRIARHHVPGVTQALINAAGDRPYIRFKGTTHWVWRKWDIQPGELYLSDAERRLGERFQGRVLIEPNTKDPQGNKAWLWDRWQQVADELGGESLVQCGEPQARRLRGVEFVPTTFRQALGVLAGASMFLGTEGALHHAAAAMGKPAVVLWSEFISPEFTGYPTHVNLRRAQRVCGARYRCHSCRASMEAIEVDDVLAAMGARVIA